MKRHEKLKIGLGPLSGEATGPLAVIGLVLVAVLVIVLLL